MGTCCLVKGGEERQVKRVTVPTAVRLATAAAWTATLLTPTLDVVSPAWMSAGDEVARTTSILAKASSFPGRTVWPDWTMSLASIAEGSSVVQNELSTPSMMAGMEVLVTEGAFPSCCEDGACNLDIMDGWEMLFSVSSWTLIVEMGGAAADRVMN